jgi:short-subunit dehydrogenase
MRHILIIGATSAIAEATARRFAHNGDRLYLVARNQERLAAMASDLKTRGATQVETMVLDVNDTAKHADLISQAETTMGELDTILIAHGTLSDQKACEASFDETLKELQTNCLSVISLLTHVANRFEEQKRGTIVAISSVAGDRGRQSNYVYGTAKAAVTTFLQGLRNRLYRSGVTVITIKPGFVDTPMTASFRKGKLWASPEQIGKGIDLAIKRKNDVVYLPWFWKFTMVVIKLLPETFFKKIKL